MFISKSKLVIGILIIVILVPLITCFQLLTSPLIAKEQPETSFVFKTGTPVKQLAYALQAQQVLKYPRLLILLSTMTGTSNKLKAGEYDITHQTSTWQLWLQLKRGPVTPYSFTIIEGWTFQNLLDALAKNPDIIHTIKDLTVSDVMKAIDHEGEIPEGRFFPDTYKFSHDTKDIDILLRAYLLMEIKLNQAWLARDPNTPYSCPYKALIAASIIEKEASVPAELPIVAGVIARRLQQNMYLQVDPTVIYGLGTKYSGRLTSKDLQTNTPYNTYLHKNLPPTPICAPGAKAIYAAMQPDNSAFLYYVSKGDGSHEFSSTLEEHNLAVKKYLLDKKEST
jgi:UPF0755 protein